MRSPGASLVVRAATGPSDGNDASFCDAVVLMGWASKTFFHWERRKRTILRRCLGAYPLGSRLLATIGEAR